MRATYGKGARTEPFCESADEAVRCAEILAKRLNDDPTHTMDGGKVSVKTAEEGLLRGEVGRKIFKISNFHEKVRFSKKSP